MCHSTITVGLKKQNISSLYSNDMETDNAESINPSPTAG